LLVVKYLDFGKNSTIDSFFRKKLKIFSRRGRLINKKKVLKLKKPFYSFIPIKKFYFNNFLIINIFYKKYLLKYKKAVEVLTAPKNFNTVRKFNEREKIYLGNKIKMFPYKKVFKIFLYKKILNSKRKLKKQLKKTLQKKLLEKIKRLVRRLGRKLIKKSIKKKFLKRLRFRKKKFRGFRRKSLKRTMLKYSKRFFVFKRYVAKNHFVNRFQHQFFFRKFEISVSKKLKLIFLKKRFFKKLLLGAVKVSKAKRISKH
jgi:hypothetical protein